jgi:hypothetical protein
LTVDGHEIRLTDEGVTSDGVRAIDSMRGAEDDASDVVMNRPA